jgi:putative hydrolase of the HAD superfamily
MTQYKHYSFDLWQTLIKSHPEYKRQRANYFYKHFNRKNLSEETVFIIIRDIEKMVDSVNQITGLNMRCVEIVAMILVQLEYDINDLSIDDMIAIVHMLQQNILDLPPVLYDNDTKGVLHYLHSEGATLSILSNTAFIVGSTLDKVLDILEIGKYFSFSIYSDQEGISKPCPRLFQLMIQTTGVTKDKIIHIGDNPIADIKGAESAGIASMQINTVSQTIKNIPV